MKGCSEASDQLHVGSAKNACDDHSSSELLLSALGSPPSKDSTKTVHRVTFDLVITSCTLCTIQSAQTQSDKSMEELYMPRRLNALSDMEQGHSGFPLSFLFLWMAKKFKLKCKIRHMVEVSSQSLFCCRQ